MDGRHNERTDMIQSSNKRQNFRTYILKEMDKIYMQILRNTKENLNNWKRLPKSHIRRVNIIKMSSVLSESINLVCFQFLKHQQSLFFFSSWAS